ncbi:MAG: sigma-70 family RNA polymerase sigma factor [Gemmatimonadaceae bacterium]
MIPADIASDQPRATDDLALVRRIAHGDPVALSALYDRHAQALHSHAFHLLGGVAEAEDAVEETFWRVWQRAGNYDPTLADVATWLLLICRQRVAERLRGRKRPLDGVLEDTTGLPAAAAAHSGGIPGAAQQRIAAALASVPADQRTVLELAFFRGMSSADVATLTKQSPETARTRLRVAMRKLRDALAEPAAPDASATEGTP